MHVQHICQQGQGVFNEDAVILNGTHQIYGVVDGVSGLQPFHQDNASAGQIAARIVAEHFTSTNHQLPSLTRLSLAANDQLRHTMLEAHINLLDPTELWGAVHAVIQIHPEHIDWVQTGDCMIYAVYDSALVRTITHDSVDVHDDRALQLWYQKYNGKHVQGLKPDEVIRRLQQNRQLANQPGGYSVINGQIDAVHYMESGRFATNGLRYILIVSDGIYPWLPAYPMMQANPNASPFEFVMDVIDMGLENYVERLIRWETEDVYCQEHPRFKVSDDKSALLITF